MSEQPGGVLEAAEGRNGRLGAAAYAFSLCLVTLAALGAAGLVVNQPYLFPSLGPTVMLFFGSPMQRAAAPRNAVVGHSMAIAAGVACLVIFGLTDNPPAIEEGLTIARVGAAALSVALTALFVRLLGSLHPPAGATTLLISLGLLTSAAEILAIAVGVAFVIVLGVALNRLLGVHQPWWA